MARNERTPARGDGKSKTDKPEFARDFTSLEKRAEQLDKDSVAFYVLVTEAYISDRDKTGIGKEPWCKEWGKQFPYRAVSTIRGHLTYTVQCADAGYDLSAFETMEHFRQQVGAKTRTDRNDARKKSGNGTAYDAVLKPALALSATNKKKLIAELMASL